MLVAYLSFAVCALVLQAADISLPSPGLGAGVPNVLSRRSDAASFSNVGFTEQMVADMLWASCGVNRPLDNGGRRTTNYSWNKRDTDVYLAASNGLFLYDAVEHRLVKKHNNDIRSLINSESVNPAYVVIHVSNSDRLGSAGSEYGAIHSAFCAENVLLYCTDQGLSISTSGTIPSGLRTAMGLDATQDLIHIVQTIGIPSSAPGSSQVNVTAGSGGMVSGSSSQSIAYRGTGQSASARPYPGYQFAYWSGLPGGRVTVVPLPLENVVCPMNITAVFEEAFPMNNPPVLDAVGDRSVRAGSEIQIGINATDTDGNDLDYAATGE